MSDRAAILTLDAVTAGYGVITAVRDVSLVVAQGEIVCLLGANGAGKTTMLRAISGMVRARGSITLAGRELPKGQPDRTARAGVAHVPEGRGTFPNLTVDENLRVGAHTLGRRAVATELGKWYSFFPRLAERSRQLAGTLSGGEQQMLAVARALMSRPVILVLDEPSLGLAPNTTKTLLDELARINRIEGMPMLLVEQNARLALAIAARAYVMEAGRIVLAGSSGELAGDARVRRAYLGV